MSCREQGKKRNEKEEEETKDGKKRRRVTIFQLAVLVALLLPVLLFISWHAYQTFGMLITYCVCLQCYQGKHDSPPSESLEIRENLKQNICPNIS